jgi:hypothetical protein
MMLVDQSSGGAPGWEVHIANRLLARYGGETVHLTKVRHHLLTPEEVKAGRRLDEESTYEILGEFDHRRTEPLPSGAAESAIVIPGGAR